MSARSFSIRCGRKPTDGVNAVSRRESRSGQITPEPISEYRCTVIQRSITLSVVLLSANTIQFGFGAAASSRCTDMRRLMPSAAGRGINLQLVAAPADSESACRSVRRASWWLDRDGVERCGRAPAGQPELPASARQWTTHRGELTGRAYLASTRGRNATRDSDAESRWCIMTRSVPSRAWIIGQ